MGAVADRSTAGIRPEAVTAWFVQSVPGIEPPLRFELVAGGRSNLTFRVEDAGGRSVALRRPPISHVLPTAHDMAREHRILEALVPTAVPVPRPLGLCDDPSVTGAPFYVMTFVEGLVLRDATTAEAAMPDLHARRMAGEQLADVLAELHRVDVDAAGLGTLARREGYIERQLRRWSSQFAQTCAAGVREPGQVEAVGEALAARIPTQRETAVVHGDYRLDNAVVAPSGQVEAILDWELCTLGDPLADLGTFVDYWSLPADGGPILGRAPASALAGFPGTEDLVARYAATSGRDVSNVAYFMAFGYWRLACILQGVYARYRAGAAAGDPQSVEELPETVARLARLATATLGLP